MRFSLHESNKEVAGGKSFLTLMLFVQRIGLPQPYQTTEQQQWPEDLNQKPDLDKDKFNPTQIVPVTLSE